MREQIPQPKRVFPARTREHSRWSQISALIRLFSCFSNQKTTCKALKNFQLLEKMVSDNADSG